MDALTFANHPERLIYRTDFPGSSKRRLTLLWLAVDGPSEQFHRGAGVFKDEVKVVLGRKQKKSKRRCQVKACLSLRHGVLQPSKAVPFGIRKDAAVASDGWIHLPCGELDRLFRKRPILVG